MKHFADNRIEIAAQAYIEEPLSKVDAYLRAYPGQKNSSRKSQHENASRMFATDAMKARLKEMKAEHRARHAKTVDDIVERLEMQAFADVTEIYDDTGALLPPKMWPDDVKARLSGLDVVSIGGGGESAGQVMKVKLESGQEALKLLGKQLGMWPSKTEITGADGGPIKTEEVVSDVELARKIAFLLRKGLEGA